MPPPARPPISSATRADIGTVQTGRYADIVAVNDDPLKDVTALQHVAFVMKGGAVYKENGKIVPR